MSRPPQYGDVMRDARDGSLWMLLHQEMNEETGYPYKDWMMIPLTDSEAEEATALCGAFYGEIDGMEFV